MERLFTVGFFIEFLSHTDSIGNKRGGYISPPRSSVTAYRPGCLLLGRLLPSRAYILLTS